jgi:hypothetical protein
MDTREGKSRQGMAVGSVRVRLRAGWVRMRSGWLQIIQTALAACVAWFLAVLILGVERPTFAPIVAVIALGLAMGLVLRCEEILAYLSRIGRLEA